MYRTGGGPSNAPEFDDVEERVRSICSNLSGLEARHDSDTIATSKLVEEVLLETTEVNSAEKIDMKDTTLTQRANIKIPVLDMEETFIVNMTENDESQKENRWDTWHPKALKTRVLSNLTQQLKWNGTAKLDKLSVAQLELVQLQLDTAKSNTSS